MKTELTTIDSTSLQAVTGGTMSMPMPTAPASTSAGSSSSSTSSSSDTLMTALSSIRDSIKVLGHKNDGPFGGDNIMLFMMMGMAFGRRG